MYNSQSNRVSGYLSAGMSPKDKRVAEIAFKVTAAIFAAVIVVSMFTPAWGGGLFLLWMMGPWYLLIYLLFDTSTYQLSSEGIAVKTRRKAYCYSYKWDEVVEVSEILIDLSDRYTKRIVPYIALMRKSQAELFINIANSREYAVENYREILSNPYIIAIPKTEESVRFIGQYKTIQPLPEDRLICNDLCQGVKLD